MEHRGDACRPGRRLAAAVAAFSRAGRVDPDAVSAEAYGLAATPRPAQTLDAGRSQGRCAPP
jgi:hypothetical protein